MNGKKQVHKTNKEMLNVLKGQKNNYTPIWLMRQAGRYLPEYRNLRAKAKNFLNLCLTPQWASEITLQPINRYGFDAAILFADILLVPMALGIKLEFLEGEGPVLEDISNEQQIDGLFFDNEKVTPVYEAISLIKNKLPSHTAFIGFCGAPWTVACYMIDGRGKTGFLKAKSWAKEQPELLDKLIFKLIEASEIYLSQQIEAGVEILQIFDSWSGLLEGNDFIRWVVKPTHELVKRMKDKYPHISIIGFPREAGSNYQIYLEQTGVDAVSIDQSVDLETTGRQLQKMKPLQGNLDPDLLVKGGKDMLKAAEKIITTLGPRHIFNLGHGVVPQTPPENVAELVNFVQGYK